MASAGSEIGASDVQQEELRRIVCRRNKNKERLELLGLEELAASIV